MIAVHHYQNGQVKEFEADDISKLVHDAHLLWVDVANPSENDLQSLQQEFSLHPLAMEDVREHHQRPKLEKYPTHAFIVVYSSDLQEINIFVGPSWVITVRESDAGGSPWSLEGAKVRFDRTHPEQCDVGYLLGHRGLHHRFGLGMGPTEAGWFELMRAVILRSTAGQHD